ncbi:MAG TPA: GNAT family N-acetyltransferase [Dehalococcoidia bacterium]|nr:GNAT family N-acetyltransferase [Dehalococcoidia bacterium]
MDLEAVIIRDATLDEAGAVSDVIRTAYAQFETTYPVDFSRYFEMVVKIERHFENAEIIVAERDGRLIGTVFFYRDGSLSAQGPWPEGSAGVLRLAVIPEARGMGLARRLTDECIRRCHDYGIKTLALHTTDWMPVAKAMYERMGFVRDQSFDFVRGPGSTPTGTGWRFRSAEDP